MNANRWICHYPYGKIGEPPEWRRTDALGSVYIVIKYDPFAEHWEAGFTGPPCAGQHLTDPDLGKLKKRAHEHFWAQHRKARIREEGRQCVSFAT